MANTFTSSRKSTPVAAFRDKTWLAEIEDVERAVRVLLETKREMLRADPHQEHVQHMRHVARLRRIKRMLDAICV